MSALSHDYRILFLNSLESSLGFISNASLLHYNPRMISSKLRVQGHYTLMLLLEGEGMYLSPGEKPRRLFPGDTVLTCPRSVSTYTPPRGKSWTEIYAVFDGPIFNAMLKSGVIDPGRPIRHLQPVEEWHDRFARALPNTAPKTSGQHAVQVMHFAAFLTEVLTQENDVQGRESDHPNWVNAARLLLESNLSEEKDLCGMAAGLNVPYETFRKRLTRELGMPPGVFRRSRRLAVAAELLRTTDLTTREIAEATGLGNEFMFSRRFKQEMGLSPRAYRAKFTS